MAGSASGGARRNPYAPYLLVIPGLAYLALFFVVPIVTLAKTSLSVREGSPFDPTYSFTWEFSNYTESLDRFSEQFLRSFQYAAIATVVALLLAYPLAYVIAFRAGKAKNLLLGLVILPFFVTFLVRTLAWKTILGDDGWVVDLFQTIGIVPDGGRILSTPGAVVFGLMYNFLPFMILPVYVSLEKIDPRLLEANRDLYGSAFTGFRKVVFPLSLPGVFAGSLLTFIPACGDFINQQYLGSPQESMIGTVIQEQFLKVKDYPVAASLSFVLMAVILVGVLVYAKVLGTEELA